MCLSLSAKYGSKSCLFELKHSIRLSDSAQCLGPLCLWQCCLYTLVPPGKNSTIYWVREIIGDNDDIILKLLSIFLIITTPSFFCILRESLLGNACGWTKYWEQLFLMFRKITFLSERQYFPSSIQGVSKMRAMRLEVISFIKPTDNRTHVWQLFRGVSEIINNN